MNSPSDADRAPAGDRTSSCDAHWRADIASLVFPVPEHRAICAVHRGAFRTLLGTDPTADACLAHFRRFEQAFKAAARAKIERKRIPLGTNLHLTSRDITRKLLEADQIECGERP
ncbi:hypothetical protein ABIF38_007664 [Bradyrhizobium japonicum]|jgi:hypothetical protein|uniref:hypothetical protein n=1 Tax=Bradyrhizobium TaxID=374 RepID=UPI0003AB14BE|nr:MULTISPECIES: hypothetical protein [Bradyrhizobium]MBP2427755.1 hypothetical protein [Bradyrhizobium elkanii]MCP1730021.1 hypothetical protein [Bradyrhizobium elkanii]MCP1930476.1 hypothetical protein [Bradyrhizobium elkanii]MCP1970953.1 hypothetical protein [Bradyrhizobium elkanii]MCS3481265.1 hypothetical protein [Bradyrhizobium elkanii]